MTLLQALWYIARLTRPNDPALDLQIVPFLLGFNLLLGITISLISMHEASWIRQKTSKLIQNEKLLILSLCVVFFAISGMCIKHSSWGGDEQAMFTASSMVAEKGVKAFFAHYGEVTWLGTQHPPLAPVMSGLFMYAWGLNPLVFRLPGLFLALPTVLLTYFISRELTDRTTGFLTALLLLSCPRFLQIVFQVTNDIFIAFFFTLAIFLIIRMFQMPSYWLAALTGLVVGAGLLSKYTMVFFYLMVPGLLYLSLGSQKRGPSDHLPPTLQPTRACHAHMCYKHMGIIGLISISILAAWLLYAHHLGIFAAQEQRILQYAGLTPSSQDVPLLTEAWRMKMRLDMLLPRAPYALGIYNMPMLVLGGILVLRRRASSDRFILLWIAAVALPVMLFLPVDRYLIPAFPAFAMIMAHSRLYLPSGMTYLVILALFYSVSQVYLYLNYTSW